MFTDLLNTTKTYFDEWLQPIPDEMANPLVAERDYIVPDGVEPRQFSEFDWRRLGC